VENWERKGETTKVTNRVPEGVFGGPISGLAILSTQGSKNKKTKKREEGKGDPAKTKRNRGAETKNGEKGTKSPSGDDLAMR